MSKVNTEEYSKLNYSFSIVIKNLELIESNVYDSESLEKKINQLLMLAYVFRIAIVEKIDENPVWLTRDSKILISRGGLLDFDKYSIVDATALILSKIYQISKYNKNTYDTVSGIVDKGTHFYLFDAELSSEHRRDIYNKFM